MKTALFLLGISATLSSALSYPLKQATPVMEEFLKEMHQAYNHTFLVRRGLESDWYKMVFGFQRGALKVQTRMSQNCLSDGYQMLKGLIDVGKEYWKTGDEDIYYNVNDIWLSFNTKCNMIDTVQGTIVTNFIANHL